MKFVYKNHIVLLLLCLIFLGSFLRFFNLSHFPVSPNWDEVSHGYNAYSILKSGMDEWGKFFPLIFRAYGDYKLPVYIYLTTIPVYLFGLSVFSLRFISALAGVLAIPGIFLLTRELFPSKKLALFSAFLLTISPWHFFISRPALEANLALTFIIFGFYFLLRFFKNTSSLLPAVLFLSLSLHTYNTARIFVPLLVIAAFVIFRPTIRSFYHPKSLTAMILAILSTGLVIFQVYVGEGTARYEKLKILSPSTVFQIGEKFSHSTLPPLLAKIIYNRPVYFLSTVSKNYLSYFSPSFFNQTWGAQFQFAIPNQNLLTLPVYLLAFLGIFSYLRNLKTNKSFVFLYTWLLLSPLAASLTVDPPQALRPNPMIPALMIFACLGLVRLLLVIPPKVKNLVVILVSLWILVSFLFYVQNYTTDYAKKYSSSWQYGYRPVVDYINEHGQEYQNIFITKRYGEPHLFYAFYSQLNPRLLQPGADNIRFTKSDWFWTDKIGKIYFVNDWQIPEITVASLPLESGSFVSTAKSLLVTSPDHVPVNAHVLEKINFLDGSPAYIITSIP